MMTVMSVMLIQLVEGQVDGDGDVVDGDVE